MARDHAIPAARLRRRGRPERVACRRHPRARGAEDRLRRGTGRAAGRGDRQMQLSLSRALTALGEEAVEPVLRAAMTNDDPHVRAHASATERLLREPDGAFQLDVAEAKRISFSPRTGRRADRRETLRDSMRVPQGSVRNRLHRRPAIAARARRARCRAPRACRPRSGDPLCRAAFHQPLLRQREDE